MLTRWSSYYKEDERALDINTTGSVYSAFKSAAARFAGRTAIEFGRFSMTYERLLEEVDKVAFFLKSKGISKDDNVAIVHNGIPATVIAFYALGKLGCRTVLINPNAKAPRMEEILTRNGCVAVFTSGSAYREMSLIIEKTKVSQVFLSKISDYIVFRDRIRFQMRSIMRRENGASKSTDDLPGVKIYEWDEIISPATVPEGGSDEVKAEYSSSIILVNGAASGELRDVEIRSDSVNAQAALSAFLYKENAEDKETVRVFSTIDKSYSYGIIGIHTVMLSGNTMLLYGNATDHIPVFELRLYHPDVLIAYPSMLAGFNTDPKCSSLDLKYLKLVISVGDFMTGTLHNNIRSYLQSHGSSASVTRTYGTVETSSICIYNPERLDNDRTVGIPLPGVSVKIYDPETDSDCPIDSDGEILVNTPGAMTGYVSDPDATDKVRRIQHDGRIWLMTGDIGRIDENGLIYYEGSRKRVQVIRGLHVYPQLIENEIKTIYGVSEVCVVILKHDEGTFTLSAEVVPSDEFLFDNDRLTLLKDTIITQCQMIFPNQMWVDEVEFRAYLPKKYLGIIDKDEVQKDVMKRKGLQ